MEVMNLNGGNDSKPWNDGHVLIHGNFSFCLVCKKPIYKGSYADNEQLVSNHLLGSYHEENVRNLFKMCIPDPFCHSREVKYLDIVNNSDFDISLVLNNDPSYIFKRNDCLICLVCKEVISQFPDDDTILEHNLVCHLHGFSHLNNLKTNVCWVYWLKRDIDFIMFCKSIVYCSICKQTLKSTPTTLIQSAVAHLLINPHGDRKSMSEDELSDSSSCSNHSDLKPNDNLLDSILGKNTLKPFTELLPYQEKDTIQVINVETFAKFQSEESKILFLQAKSKYKDSSIIDDSVKRLSRKCYVLLLNKRYIREKDNNFFCDVCQEIIVANDTDKYIKSHCYSMEHNNILTKNASEFVSKLEFCPNSLHKNSKKFDSVLSELSVNVELMSHLKYMSDDGQNFVCLLCRMSFPFSPCGQYIQSHILCFVHQQNTYDLNCKSSQVKLQFGDIDFGLYSGDVMKEYNEKQINSPLSSAVNDVKQSSEPDPMGAVTELLYSSGPLANDIRSNSHRKQNVGGNPNDETIDIEPVYRENSSDEEYYITSSKNEIEEPVTVCDGVVICPECGDTVEILNKDVEFSLKFHMQEHKDLSELNYESEMEYQEDIEYFCRVCEKAIHIFNKNVGLSFDRHMETCNQSTNKQYFEHTTMCLVTGKEEARSLDKINVKQVVDVHTFIPSGSKEKKRIQLQMKEKDRKLAKPPNEIARAIKRLSKNCYGLQLNKKYIKEKGNKLFCEICQDSISFTDSGSYLKQHFYSSAHNQLLLQNACAYISSIDVKGIDPNQNSEKFDSVLSELRKQAILMSHIKYISNDGENFVCLLCHLSFPFTLQSTSVKGHVVCFFHQQKAYELNCLSVKNGDKSQVNSQLLETDNNSEILQNVNSSLSIYNTAACKNEVDYLIHMNSYNDDMAFNPEHQDTTENYIKDPESYLQTQKFSSELIKNSEIEFEKTIDEQLCPFCEETIPILNKNIDASINEHFEIRHQDQVKTNNEFSENHLGLKFLNYVLDHLPDTLGIYRNFIVIDGNSFFCKLCSWSSPAGYDMFEVSEAIHDHLLEPHHETQFKIYEHQLSAGMMNQRHLGVVEEVLEQGDRNDFGLFYQTQRIANPEMVSVLTDLTTRNSLVKLNSHFFREKNGHFFCDVCLKMIKFNGTGTSLTSHCYTTLHNEILLKNGDEFILNLGDEKGGTSSDKKGHRFKVVLDEMAKKFPYKIMTSQLQFVTYTSTSFICLLCFNKPLPFSKFGKSLDGHFSSVGHRRRSFEINCQGH